jgi:phage shock protein A
MADWKNGAVAALALIMLAACSSVPAPRQELGTAKQAVSQARATNAPEYAPEVFSRANAKLAKAQAALENGEHALARRLAKEATVDAELAEATAGNAQNQTALNELRLSIKSLEDRIYEAPAQANELAPQPVYPPAQSSNAIR